MKRLRRNLITAFLGAFVVLTSLVMQPQAAFAQVPTGWSAIGGCVVKETDSNNVQYSVATIQGAQCLIANILSVAITAIGLAGFVMFIIGSFNYLLSGGNSKGVEGARNTFTFAVVGLVVALSAIIILRIVAGFTGVQGILNFHIPASTSCNGLPSSNGCP